MTTLPGWTTPTGAKHCVSMTDSPVLLTYPVREVIPYISWGYFFHAWGFKGNATRSPEAQQLQADALHALDEWAGRLHVRCLYRLCRANADGDNILLEGTTLFPLLRQQTPHADGSPLLCLSDFIRPLSCGTPDTIGLFASSVADDLDFSHDPYRQLLLQTLSDRLAEAAVEKMHRHVRRKAWGYAPDESLSIPDLLAERFQGIRPAVGYPSLPDQSVNFLLNDLLDLKRIGITLTENGAMHPHSSVSGLMLAHPAARYFSVGPIGEDQLCDYAHRRGLPVGMMRKFLAGVL